MTTGVTDVRAARALGRGASYGSVRSREGYAA
jgi:hypothetical protein